MKVYVCIFSDIKEQLKNGHTKGVEVKYCYGPNREGLQTETNRDMGRNS